MNSKRKILCLALAISWLVSDQTARAEPELYRRVLRSTGWVMVQEKENRLSFGTCWVVDKKRKQVMTNHHVVGRSVDVKVFFPRTEEGQVLMEPEYYLHNVSPLHGKVIAKDIKRDLALIELDTLPRSVQSIPLAAKLPEVGQTVHSIGNSPKVGDGKLWRYTQGKVNRIFFMVSPGKISREVNVVQTKARHDCGDSGGPLVNDQGQLVGVIEGVSKKKNTLALSVHVSEVREFLRRVNHPDDKKELPVAVVGSWKGTTREDDEEWFCSATFRADGTFDWVGAKLIQGKYNYESGELQLITQDKEMQKVGGKITWTGQNKFSIHLGKARFVFDRR